MNFASLFLFLFHVRTFFSLILPAYILYISLLLLQIPDAAHAVARQRPVRGGPGSQGRGTALHTALERSEEREGKQCRGTALHTALERCEEREGKQCRGTALHTALERAQEREGGHGIGTPSCKFTSDAHHSPTLVKGNYPLSLLVPLVTKRL